ncbi:conserved hypothetical protein [methanotrophic bacterial endosymbiont of Bathymodiolus sp.]|nr:conserved hypothetical protein [methanotrophic bacterial endosymbiont of Bathymodiolus sp.]
MVSGKHPHGRGEDLGHNQSQPMQTETPPRAWGRLFSGQNNAVIPGNTPTGVGKTFDVMFRGGAGRKHPHGRGEDMAYISIILFALETPPRAWGRLYHLSYW